MKQRVQKLPKEETEGTHFNDKRMDERLKKYADLCGSIASDKHQLKFFTEHIGAENCLVVSGAESENVK